MILILARSKQHEVSQFRIETAITAYNYAKRKCFIQIGHIGLHILYNHFCVLSFHSVLCFPNDYHMVKEEYIIFKVMHGKSHIPTECEPTCVGASHWTPKVGIQRASHIRCEPKRSCYVLLLGITM